MSSFRGEKVFVIDGRFKVMGQPYTIFARCPPMRGNINQLVAARYINISLNGVALYPKPFMKVWRYINADKTIDEEEWSLRDLLYLWKYLRLFGIPTTDVFTETWVRMFVNAPVESATSEEINYIDREIIPHLSLSLIDKGKTDVVMGGMDGMDAILREEIYTNPLDNKYLSLLPERAMIVPPSMRRIVTNISGVITDKPIPSVMGKHTHIIFPQEDGKTYSVGSLSHMEESKTGLKIRLPAMLGRSFLSLEGSTWNKYEYRGERREAELIGAIPYVSFFYTSADLKHISTAPPSNIRDSKNHLMFLRLPTSLGSPEIIQDIYDNNTSKQFLVGSVRLPLFGSLRTMGQRSSYFDEMIVDLDDMIPIAADYDPDKGLLLVWSYLCGFYDLLPEVEWRDLAGVWKWINYFIIPITSPMVDEYLYRLFTEFPIAESTLTFFYSILGSRGIPARVFKRLKIAGDFDSTKEASPVDKAISLLTKNARRDKVWTPFFNTFTFIDYPARNSYAVIWNITDREGKSILSGFPYFHLISNDEKVTTIHHFTNLGKVLAEQTGHKPEYWDAKKMPTLTYTSSSTGVLKLGEDSDEYTVQLSFLKYDVR